MCFRTHAHKTQKHAQWWLQEQEITFLLMSWIWILSLPSRKFCVLQRAVYFLSHMEEILTNIQPVMSKVILQGQWSSTISVIKEHQHLSVESLLAFLLPWIHNSYPNDSRVHGVIYIYHHHPHPKYAGDPFIHKSQKEMYHTNQL